MSYLSIEEVEIADKRVFIRCDLDGALDAACRTIGYAVEAGARVIVGSHLGKPGAQGITKGITKGTAKERTKGGGAMERIGMVLAERLEVDVLFPGDCKWDVVRKLAQDMHTGSVMLLADLFSYPGGEGRDTTALQPLAAISDVYVNEAFGVSHHDWATLVKLPALVPERALGLGCVEEARAVARLLTEPARPLVALIGGGVSGEQLALAEALANIADEILLGGELSHTVMRAVGRDIGRSSYAKRALYRARTLHATGGSRGKMVVLPSDFMTKKTHGRPEIAELGMIPPSAAIIDIGPATTADYAARLRGAGTAFISGTMGPGDSHGPTASDLEIARAAAGAGTFSYALGDEACAAITKAGASGMISHLSMCTESVLYMVQGKPLPALAALLNPKPE